MERVRFEDFIDDELPSNLNKQRSKPKTNSKRKTLHAKSTLSVEKEDKHHRRKRSQSMHNLFEVCRYSTIIAHECTHVV